MKKYKRICRICGKELEYGSYSAYYLAEKCNAVCRICATRKNAKRKCDLSSLLEETPEAYYWIGFLLADGHFENGRIKFHLASKDSDQVKKFANFIKWTGNFDDRGELGIGVAAKHTEVVDELCKKFDIKKNKTYNPPKTILNHNKELLKYLLIGFIDGDGTINENSIRFRIHSSWLNILNEFANLFDNEKKATTTKDGYAYWRINKHNTTEVLLPLMSSVPYLKRKWEHLTTAHNNTKTIHKRYNISDRTTNILHMIENGASTKEVSKRFNITTDCVLKIKSRYGVCVNRVNKEKSSKLKKEILNLIHEGKKYKEISSKLGISISYISKIKNKYG
jgi:DNA-binding CsgD family transcriptional regulator